jgi:hypothetical protein
MLQLAGLLLLVALILVGALMPLKYTARMKLPRLKSPDEADASPRDPTQANPRQDPAP